MKIKITLILFVFSTVLSLTSVGQDIQVIKFPELEKMINDKHDTLMIFNFWATWCKSCVVEIPYFESLNHEYPDIKVVFVSLDFVEDLDSKVKNFVNRKGIHSQIVLLDDIDYNSWINKIDENWSGAIPATLIIDGKSGIKKFYEREFKEGELETVVDEFRTSL